MTFIEVILPLSVSGVFTYNVPKDLENKIGIGYRVIVPLGKRNKFYTGIISSMSTVMPSGDYEIKSITDVLDEYPVVIHPQLKLWEWISNYYLCNIGDVYKAAVPSGLRLESESWLELSPEYYEASNNLNALSKESVIASYIESKGRTTILEIQKGTGLKNLDRTIATMLKEGLIVISEKLQERYRTKKETFVKLCADSPNDFSELFNKVRRAEKQERLLQFLIKETTQRKLRGDSVEISKKELLEISDVSAHILDELIKKGIAEQYSKEVNRFSLDGKSRSSLPVLTTDQQKALENIKSNFQNFTTVLLHGVTSSGKTEIYQHLISEVFDSGGQVLLLVPEIALTTQLTRRMQNVFGEKVLIYHSKFSDNDRAEQWLNLLKNSGPALIIGVRSSVFLPFKNLRLIIVDEEHESSYKQSDSTPRYNARDVSIMLASMHGAKVLLGTATPSIETYWKALNGKFGHVELLNRYYDAALPVIEICDMTKAYNSKSVAGGFALSTLKYIKDIHTEGKQSIIFQNRRGYAPIAKCKMCAWTPKCDNCDVSLTYHKGLNRLECHYCGASYPVPEVCPQCKEPTVEIYGYGTERVEEEISSRMPNARIVRMDLDTTRNKDNYSKIIDDFSSHKSDVLVGTQMITKGLDFGNVKAVVVINADSMINYPDFRAAERAFNMLEQVGGRAGRKGEGESKVIFQSFNPDISMFKYLKNHDYVGFYKEQIEERHKFKYPPFSRIINIYLKHRERDVLNKLSIAYADVLRHSLTDRVLGPEEPLVSRIQNFYIKRIMLKLETDSSILKIRDYLRQIYLYLSKVQPEMKSAVLYYDVDPC